MKITKGWNIKQFLLALVGVVIAVILIGQLVNKGYAVLIVIALLIVMAFVWKKFQARRAANGNGNKDNQDEEGEN